MSGVTRFPVSTWDRIKNRRGRKAANCIVTGRYLKFHDISGPPYQIAAGTPVCVDVMTDTNEDPNDPTPDRKLCELYLTLEELEDIVSKLRAEVDGT